MSTNKLFRASKDFVKKSDDHCLLLSLNKDKSAVEAVGDNILEKTAVEKNGRQLQKQMENDIKKK
jgi:hypothetical protein